MISQLLPLVVLYQLFSTPGLNISVYGYNIPNDILLSDPEFYLSSKLDVIIFLSLFWDLITDWWKNSTVEKCSNSSKYQVGLGCRWPFSSVGANMSCNFAQLIPEDYQLRKFWEIEELSSVPILCQNDAGCGKIFHATIICKGDGRFVAHLPLKQHPHFLDDSFESANQQFLRSYVSNADLQEMNIWELNIQILSMNTCH